MVSSPSSKTVALIALLALSSNVESFVPRVAARRKASAALRSTTLGAPSTSSTSSESPGKLVPPPEINPNDTAALFEERIQKTYG